MTTINTDLLTPLGAYLRLRDDGPRELHPRVGRARPPRPQLVDGRRLAHRRRSTRRRSSGSPSSATSPTTTSRTLEPTVPLPEDGRELPGEPARRLRDARPLRPRRRARPRCSPGDADEIAGRLDGGIPWRREPRGVAGPIRRSPERARYERDGAAVQGAHRRRRRLPVRAVAAGRAADVGLAARRLPGAPARQPVAVPLPARARRDRARRLLARAAGRLRERPREPRARSPARPSRPKATSSACSRPRRTAPST